MPSLPLIQTPFSAPWMTWVLIGLFVIVTIALLVNGSQFIEGFTTFFSRIERRYSDGAMGIGMGLLMHVFRVVVVALALYWSVWNIYTPDRPFEPLPLVLMMAAALVVWGVHHVLLFWVCSTFSLRQEMQTFTLHYVGLWTVVAIVLYGLVLVGSYLESPQPIVIAIGVVMALYVIAVVVKTCTFVPLSLRQLIYMPLYVVTVDVVPLAGLFWIGKYIVTI